MLKKYEFTDLQEFQGILGETKLTHKPIVLGHKIIEEGEYDEEGNETVAPIFSDKLMIDIYWEDSEDSSVLDEFEIFPNNPVHKIF